MENRDALTRCFLGFLAGINTASKLDKVSVAKGEEGTIDVKFLLISVVFLMLYSEFRYPSRQGASSLLPMGLGFSAGVGVVLFVRETGLMSYINPANNAPTGSPSL